MKQDLIEEKITLPSGVKVGMEGQEVVVEGKKGSIKRRLASTKVSLNSEGGHITIQMKDATKREKTTIGTLKAHLNNMIKGVEEGFIYKMKICSGHFPMTVTAKGQDFVVKNYLGEKQPRSLKLKEGVSVKVEGEFVFVESIDKELAGQASASIEKLTQRSKYDKRIFQDGIYIVDKAGKEIR